MALLTAATLAACSDPSHSAAVDHTRGVPPSGQTAPATSAASATPVSPAGLPGVGPAATARIPADTDQVLLVTGQARDSSTATAALYQRTQQGWRPAAAPWPAHNALNGWTDDHHVGDLRSPIGVFTLSDAGGLLADPGTKLPYHQSPGFTIGGDGFDGEPLTGSFDYVVAIDYNRISGRSPLDPSEPLGTGKGGGIWVHVDHGGPTHGCVSLSKDDMAALLRALDPEQHPVIVMGDAASLSR
ncbi:L,D-transpeptidase family protein [Kitasatospora sp. NPDC052896]|uniref:L,D-transpeptidase family protein n=1 Tax=Kitasatospora sp. NPDC052896 TaxID=3364061 RepID=UPI0037CAB393